MKFIDLKAQYEPIKEHILQRINGVLEHGQYILGPEVAELESHLAQYTGASHAVTVASGTDALLIALMAIGVKQGDEVITTPFSFFATAETIMLLGAKPVFVDIRQDTYNIDSSLIESAITDKTKAIMPVSLYGQCAEMDEINQIAKKHNLAVIEDAAQSFGATYKNQKSCHLSTIGCTSFFPSKPLGGYGDGGSCFTSDDELAQKMRQISRHGQGKRYCHETIGVNGRMDTIQAAIVIEKLKIFDEELSKRQKVASYYHHLLEGTVNLPFIHKANKSVYAQFTIEVKERDALAAFLKEKGIPTAIHYPVPMHRQPALASLDYKEGQFPVSERAASRVMSLPFSPYMKEEEQKEVAEAIKSFKGEL